MLASAFIGVVVKPQDRSTIIKPSLELLGKNIESEFKTPTFRSTIISDDTEVIRIYHNCDGNINGLGEVLLKDFNSYEKAMNLMAFGDASTIIEEKATFYNSWRNGEEWQYTKPKQFKSEQLFESKSLESYVYLFKDNQWYVKKYFSNDNSWRLLSDILKK